MAMRAALGRCAPRAAVGTGWRGFRVNATQRYGRDGKRSTPPRVELEPQATDLSTDGVPLKRSRSFYAIFPYHDLDHVVPRAEIRERLTNLASQASLCYALLGSIASAALLTGKDGSDAGAGHKAGAAAVVPVGVAVGAELTRSSGAGAALIGRRVSVDFVTDEDGSTAYCGTISGFDETCGTHMILWDGQLFESTAICLDNGLRVHRGTDGNQVGHAAGRPVNITFEPAPAASRPPSLLSFPKAALLSTFLGDDWPQRFGSPLFCVSIYSNIQGLLASMLTLAHVNTIPESSMGSFLRTFPWTIHATGFMLIPAVATLGLGLVTSVARHGGEEDAMVALGCLGLVGSTVIWSTVSMHFGGLAIRSAALRSQWQTRAAWRR